MDLNTILQTCFTKQQALLKLAELKAGWEKEKYTITSDESKPTSDVGKDPIIKTEPSIKTLEALVIFTAIPLPEDQIPILGNFVRKTFPQIKLIDLKVDPALVGGASLGWKGHLKDYSLRKILKSKF